MDVSVRDLKNGLSEHLARVRKGERLTVTLRGRPIAEIAPPAAETSLTVDERLRRMAEAGDLILPRGSPRDVPDFEAVRLRHPRAKRRGRALTASAIILADRG